jgi:Leucine-rich repeat (LRR) protein
MLVLLPKGDGMSYRCIGFLATLLIAIGHPLAQQADTADSAVESHYADDTLIVRAILDSIGRDSVSAASITKEGDGRVAYLDLSNPRLDREGMKRVPAAIGELTGLRELILNKNVISSLPSSMAHLTQLRILDLGDNELTEIPSWMGELRNLERIDLRNNEFSTLPWSFWTLGELRYVQMWGNDLETLSEDIGKLSKLEELYLQRNRLTMLPKALATMPALKYIDYDYNKLCSLEPEVEAWLMKKDKKYRQLQKCW